MRLTNPQNQRPPIILHASSVGPRSDAAAKFKTPSAAQNLLGVFRSYGHVAVDTARAASETLLGETDLADWGLLDTTLPPEGSEASTSIDKSLDALCVQRLRVAYLNSNSPLDHKQESTTANWRKACAAVTEAHKARKIDEMGLSEGPAVDVEHISQLCAEEGWLKPTVYKGVYNAAAQDIGVQLLPVLRKHGLRLYATNPYAGGLFSDSGGTACEVSPSVVSVLKKAEVHGVTPHALALRWLLHHSILDERMGDAVIIPAVDLDELEDDLRSCDDGPLPEDVVQEIEKMHSSAAGEYSSQIKHTAATADSDVTEAVI